MRMSAQEQIKIGICCLAIDLRRMRQQDREVVTGKLRRRFFDIVDPVVVSVIDPDQMDALIATLERFGLV